MPLPNPGEKESHEEFTKRCMSSDTMKKEYPDIKQRYAICESQFKSKSSIAEAFKKFFSAMLRRR